MISNSEAMPSKRGDEHTYETILLTQIEGPWSFLEIVICRFKVND